MKVAFQGERGAYSEAALTAHYGTEVEPVGYPFSEQVFDAVEQGQAEAGFIPVENSIAGPVGVNIDLLLARPVYAIAESYFLIEHCLLALPGARLHGIASVWSHPIALAQCREFINGRGWKAIPEYDTAGAARLVGERKDPSEAAIASKHCAQAYGLIVLAQGIQSVKENYTRFLAFVREKRVAHQDTSGKISLAFSVHHHPGALLDCLKLFAEHSINLSRLESRPIVANPFEYSFFVDFLGDINAAPVKAVLKKLNNTARSVKILGSYPQADRPKPTAQ